MSYEGSTPPLSPNNSVIISTGELKGCDKLNPKKWDSVTATKVAKYAGIFFGVSILAVTVCALVMKYPAASSTFFTTFGILGAGSLATLVVALVQGCKGKRVSVAISD